MVRFRFLEITAKTLALATAVALCLTGLRSVQEQSLTESYDGKAATVPSWFRDYASCVSSQEMYKKFNTTDKYNRKRGEVMHQEDTCASSDAEARIWQATPPVLQELLLQPETLVQTLLSDELPYQHILYIGDSTAWQQTRSLGCILEAAAFKEVSFEHLSLRRNESEEPVDSTITRWVHSRAGVQQSVALQFISAPFFEGVAHHLADFQRVPNLRVIVGVGAWYNSLDKAVWAKDLQDFVGSVPSIEDQLGASIYLREPLPQHFEYPDKPISDGIYRQKTEFPGNASIPPKGCAAVRDSQDFRSRAFDDKTANLLGKVHLLRDVAVPFFFSHGTAGLGQADCTHYCLPAMHVFNAALAQQVGGKGGWQSWLLSLFP